MSSFKDLRVVDNFYQTSLFFPMPTVVISTLCEDGSTNLGPYSLVQPYYVAGKDFYAMLLSCRNSSNTAQNILRNGKCCLNFVDDKKKTFKECVKLAWPGDKPEDKMPKCNFKLEKSLIEETTGEKRPMVISDAIEAIECTWVRELDNAQNDLPGNLNGYEPPYHDFNGITSQFGAHFILKIDKILMKEKYHSAIICRILYRTSSRKNSGCHISGENLAAHNLHAAILASITSSDRANTYAIIVHCRDNTCHVCSVARVVDIIPNNFSRLMDKVISIHVALISITIGIGIRTKGLALIYPHIWQ